MTKKMEIPLTEKKLFTIRESEAVANQCRSTLLKAISAGKLDAVKNGRSTLIRPDALQRWIDSFPAYEPVQLAVNTRPRKPRAPNAEAQAAPPVAVAKRKLVPRTGRQRALAAAE
jgi:excisionase family DNA binding protein